MARTKKPMTAHLPPTPCPQDMRDKLVDRAEQEGKSLAELQREAIALFLSKVTTDCIDNNAIGSEKEKQPA